MNEMADETNARKDVMTDYIVTVLLLADVILLVLVIAFSKSALVAAATVLASSAVGAVAGLLFGIPKRSALAGATARDPQGEARPMQISANTSLEEVSDWLTKTIIGVGLVSWAALLRTLDEAGLRVGLALFGPGPAALPGGVAILLASSSSAALAAYLWFSRYLPSEFDQAYRGVNAHDPRGLTQQRSAVAPPAPTGGAASFDRSIEKGLVDAEQVGGDGKSTEAKLRLAVDRKYAQMQRAPLRIDDWAKGMFGGLATVDNAFGHRELSAKVQGGRRGTYTVEMCVTAEPRPDAEAVFFLHDTFNNPTPAIAFDQTGRAVLTIKAIGAFTVGVLTDDGTTELELDLSELAGAPKAFREAE